MVIFKMIGSLRGLVDFCPCDDLSFFVLRLRPFLPASFSNGRGDETAVDCVGVCSGASEWLG